MTARLLWALTIVTVLGVQSAAQKLPLLDCLQTLTSPSGNFSSPGFPDYITDDINCAWLIVAADDSFITLEFTTFLLDNRFDIVRVYDELSTSAPLLLNHTGTELPPPVFSTGGRMMVVLNHIGFAATQYVGFEVEYSSETKPMTSESL